MKRGIALFTVVFLCVGCGSSDLVKNYKTLDDAGVWKAEKSTSDMTGLAQNLCVVNDNVIQDGMTELSGLGGLFDIADRNVIYASGVHEKAFPASVTKIMTALVFLESYQGDYSDVVTVTKRATITESGAQVCGYKAGDKVTVDQLLNGLMLYSGNDAAMILAEYCAGSVEEFVNRMNQRAVQLGATNTHFVNPHGLHDDEHYTTAYDLYLIFQKVIQYDKFRELINTKKYEGEYTQASGEVKKVSWKSTNQYFSGDREVPEGVTVVGGKTGTTNAAGACLILLAQDKQEQGHIAILLREGTKDDLYQDMTTLLGKINN